MSPQTGCQAPTCPTGCAGGSSDGSPHRLPGDVFAEAACRRRRVAKPRPARLAAPAAARTAVRTACRVTYSPSGVSPQTGCQAPTCPTGCAGGSSDGSPHRLPGDVFAEAACRRRRVAKPRPARLATPAAARTAVRTACRGDVFGSYHRSGVSPQTGCQAPTCPTGCAGGSSDGSPHRLPGDVFAGGVSPQTDCQAPTCPTGCARGSSDGSPHRLPGDVFAERRVAADGLPSPDLPDWLRRRQLGRQSAPPAG